MSMMKNVCSPNISTFFQFGGEILPLWYSDDSIQVLNKILEGFVWCRQNKTVQCLIRKLHYDSNFGQVGVNFVIMLFPIILMNPIISKIQILVTSHLGTLCRVIPLV